MICGQHIPDGQAKCRLHHVRWKNPRGTGGRRRNRSRVSGGPKGGGPHPWSVSIGFGSGFVVAEEGYVVTNFHVVERSYAILLGLEGRNAYAVELVLNFTNYIIGNRPPLSSKSWLNFSLPCSESLL